MKEQLSWKRNSKECFGKNNFLFGISRNKKMKKTGETSWYYKILQKFVDWKCVFHELFDISSYFIKWNFQYVIDIKVLRFFFSNLWSCIFMTYTILLFILIYFCIREAERHRIREIGIFDVLIHSLNGHKSLNPVFPRGLQGLLHASQVHSSGSLSSYPASVIKKEGVWTGVDI